MKSTLRPDARRLLPGLDRLLEHPDAACLCAMWGRPLVLRHVRDALDAARAAIADGRGAPRSEALIAAAAERLEALGGRGPRAVYNLTGTVIHTNLGRAPLPAVALEAIATAAGSSDLEFDLDGGGRGDRDDHVEPLLCALTGAEAATVVNNNAAAVLLVLNTFADGREVPVSRGELVEIGGSFRIPDIMRRAGARLREVGTTNRTHARDYSEAIGPDTGLLMKVHPSNYAIEGFHSEVAIEQLAEIAHAHGLPLAWDLGSGSLVDLSRFGLAREPMPGDALKAGADLVTFSGDKLLGGPQAGIIVGSRRAIEQLKRNPLKRALRVDKLTLAALTAVLRLYGDDDRLARELPVLRLLCRKESAIKRQAEGLLAEVRARFGKAWQVQCVPMRSQIGSGALPVAALPSAGFALEPLSATGRGAAFAALQRRLRRLPVPVIGRLQQDQLLLDLRCLEDSAGFLDQLDRLQPAP